MKDRVAKLIETLEEYRKRLANIEDLEKLQNDLSDSLDAEGEDSADVIEKQLDVLEAVASSVDDAIYRLTSAIKGLESIK